MHLRQTILVLALVSPVAACASSLLRGKATSAEQQYTFAVDDLESGLYPEALQGFGEVKSKYGHSKYAALADLRLGDVHLRQGNHAEAVDAYRTFLKVHPSHEEAAYATLQIGEAYYDQIPSDWWFLPPSREKDQSAVRRAITAYRDMLARFPNHELAKKARTRLAECQGRLADHEFYVADFYLKREHYRAAADRAEGLLRDYGGVGYDSRALWVVAQAMRGLAQPEAERAALEKLAKDFGDTDEGRRAAELLAPGKSMPATQEAQPTPAPQVKQGG